MVNPNPSPTASGPRQRCNQCNYFPLKPLAKFREEDITTSPVSLDSYEVPWFLRLIAPFWSLVLLLSSWLGNMLFDAAKVKKQQAKVRNAKANLLPRCPDALICPRCYEILEVMGD